MICLKCKGKVKFFKYTWEGIVYYGLMHEKDMDCENLQLRFDGKNKEDVLELNKGIVEEEK